MRGAPAPEAGVELELDRHQKQNQNQDRAWLPVVCLSVCLQRNPVTRTFLGCDDQGESKSGGWGKSPEVRNQN